MSEALQMVLGVVVTLAVYWGARRLYVRCGYFFLNPVLLSVAALIALLKLSGVSYAAYDRGGRLIGLLLGPAVVALGVPLYEELGRIAGGLKAILLSVTLGSAVGVLSAAGAAVALGASPEVTASIAPRSVTTPIAMGIAEKTGGLPPLAAALVIATGILGAAAGPPLLRLVGVRGRVAFGLAMGAAAHGIGTARALEEGEAEGASAGLAMGLSGVITSLTVSFWLSILDGRLRLP